MWKWLQRWRMFSGGEDLTNLDITQGTHVFGTTRKGKPSFVDKAIESTSAQPGDTIAIDRDGKARIVGRPLSVAVDNTAAQEK